VTTVATTRAAAVPAGLVASIRKRGRLWALLGLFVVWIVIWAITQGHNTLEISGSTRTGVHEWFRARSDWVEAAGSAGNNVFINAANSSADGMNAVFEYLQHLFTVAKFPRPLPEIGWLGTIAIAAWITYAVAGWRILLLVVPSFLAFGALGYWDDSVDLLLVTFVAVAIAAVLGIPLGVWMAHNKVVAAVVTPILDVMQTMPSFVYLLPIAILFGIGPAAAIIVTLIYAMPPVVRITAHGIRTVAPGAIEATTSLGQTTIQKLRNVELPMAKRTIIVGINQTMMAALAMATIAAYIDGPGLGQPVLSGLIRGQLGTSFVAGIAIVIMAIMLDRTTTAASVRAEHAARSGRVGGPYRKIGLAVAGIGAVVAVYLSNRYVWANEFPSSPDLGTPIRDQIDKFGDWLRSDLSGLTSSIQKGFTNQFLNPVQALIADSPWFVTGLAIVAIAWIIGGKRALAASVICLTGIYFLDLWNNAMVTLTACLVATAVVILLAVVIGVWMGRSKMADRVIRPFLDAGQTLPPFVYLIPIFILFGPNRFTAMIAGVIYAGPPAIKLVADGIRGVSQNTLEAAQSSGSNTWQMITKVQLPMAKGSLLLAANQGLLYVLSMVVIGGMAGAGALGFDIVKGFRQSEYIGRGLAAGITIVLLGIMLDRITTYGAQRTTKVPKPGGTKFGLFFRQGAART
jgi:glycine betaine/proline transport system permease protein